MSIELKIKAKSLAAESRFIRKEENRLLAISRKGNVNFVIKAAKRKYGKDWRDHIDPMLAAFHADQKAMASRIGDNWKAELEHRRKRAAAGFQSLRDHRVLIVRPVARSTHLARAYISGQPYKTVEQTCRIGPNVDAVRKMVSKYTNMNHTDKLDEWFRT